MHYQLRHGMFSPGEPFPIANQHGWEPLVAVPGVPWCDTLLIRDRAGIERATLMLRRTAAGPLHVITRGAATLAVVVRERRLFAQRAAIRLEHGAARAAGDLSGASYRIVRSGAVLADVAPSDAPGRYDVAVAPGEQDALMLAACIAIDALVREAAV